MTLHRTQTSLNKHRLLSDDKLEEYHDLVSQMRIETFQYGDIILKQNNINNKIFFIIEGMVEIILENQDYDFYDLEATSKLV